MAKEAYGNYVSLLRNGVKLFIFVATNLLVQEIICFGLFLQVWCENWSKESLHWSMDDEHSPNHIRVLGVLSNSPEFSKVWKCPKGSLMNPERDKCRIW
jgi:predicted metalloendopeptidase